MDDALGTVLFVIAAAAAGYLLFYLQGGFSGKTLSRMRASTELSFKRLKIDSDKPEFSLYGRTAEVLKVDDEVFYVNDKPTSMTLHIYARNPHGEYFYVLARTYDTPFAKHMSHASAKAVLKEKYESRGTASA